MEQRAVAKIIELMIVFCEIEERFKDINGEVKIPNDGCVIDE